MRLVIVPLPYNIESNWVEEIFFVKIVNFFICAKSSYSKFFSNYEDYVNEQAFGAYKLHQNQSDVYDLHTSFYLNKKSYTQFKVSNLNQLTPLKLFVCIKVELKTNGPYEGSKLCDLQTLNFNKITSP